MILHDIAFILSEIITIFITTCNSILSYYIFLFFQSIYKQETIIVTWVEVVEGLRQKWNKDKWLKNVNKALAGIKTRDIRVTESVQVLKYNYGTNQLYLSYEYKPVTKSEFYVDHTIPYNPEDEYDYIKCLNIKITSNDDKIYILEPTSNDYTYLNASVNYGPIQLTTYLNHFTYYQRWDGDRIRVKSEEEINLITDSYHKKLS